MVVLLSGTLFAVSAADSDGTDLRPGRYTDLASLVRSQSDDYDVLRQRVEDLTADVTTMTEQINDRSVNRYQSRIEKLRDPAGLVPRSGTGVTVTLSDAPEDVIEEVISSEAYDLNLLLVHQQDIQALVNAMWRGGATAVTIQGQRVVSTTGIKCEGSAVLLQGVPYSQPYVVTAVGSSTELVDAIEGDEYLAEYRGQAAIPEISVGWDLELEDAVTAPAYDGLLDVSYAEPLG